MREGVFPTRPDAWVVTHIDDVRVRFMRVLDGEQLEMPRQAFPDDLEYGDFFRLVADLDRERLDFEELLH